MTDGTPSRRTVLAAVLRGASVSALPAVLAACRGVQALGTPPPPPRDIQVLRAAITAEELLVARCGAAIKALSAGGTSGAAALAVHTVQAEHSAHLARLRSRLIEPSSPSPRARPSATVPPGGPSVVLQALEQAEQAASDRLIGWLNGLPPTLAQLFASIAASEATHVPYFQQVSGAAS